MLLRPRELDVLLGIASGQTVAEIAADLGISPHTAKHHAKRMHEKLGTHTQGHAVAVAYHVGLLVPRL